MPVHTNYVCEFHKWLTSESSLIVSDTRLRAGTDHESESSLRGLICIRYISTYIIATLSYDEPNESGCRFHAAGAWRNFIWFHLYGRKLCMFGFTAINNDHVFSLFKNQSRMAVILYITRKWNQIITTVNHNSYKIWVPSLSNLRLPRNL